MGFGCRVCGRSPYGAGGCTVCTPPITPTEKTKFRTVEEIMAQFGAKGKESDREYLQDVLVRLDYEWRLQKSANTSSESGPPK